MLLLLAAHALAAEPEVVVEGDAVVARAVVAVPADQALALLQDPERSHQVFGEPDSTLSAVPEGGCHRIEYHQDHAMASVAYTARACATADGVVTELVDSDAFDAMHSSWTVRTTDAGTELTFRYEADIAMPVPKWIVLSSTKKAITRSIGRLVQHLER